MKKDWRGRERRGSEGREGWVRVYLLSLYLISIVQTSNQPYQRVRWMKIFGMNVSVNRSG